MELIRTMLVDTNDWFSWKAAIGLFYKCPVSINYYRLFSNQCVVNYEHLGLATGIGDSQLSCNSQ